MPVRRKCLEDRRSPRAPQRAVPAVPHAPSPTEILPPAVLAEYASVEPIAGVPNESPAAAAVSSCAGGPFAGAWQAVSVPAVGRPALDRVLRKPSSEERGPNFFPSTKRQNAARDISPVLARWRPPRSVDGSAYGSNTVAAAGAPTWPLVLLLRCVPLPPRCDVATLAAAFSAPPPPPPPPWVPRPVVRGERVTTFAAAATRSITASTRRRVNRTCSCDSVDRPLAVVEVARAQDDSSAG